MPLPDQQRSQAEARRVEAAAPFLERQLALYTEATQVVSQIATATPKPESGAEHAAESEDTESGDVTVIDPEARFWQLYWGELALVEDEKVAGAMKAFGDALLARQDRDILEQLSLNLAHECRNSLADSWGVPLWRGP